MCLILLMASLCALIKSAFTSFQQYYFHEFEVRVSKKKQGDCCICLQPLDLKKKNVVAQKCLHLVHKGCLKQYRKYLKTDWHHCPLCRRMIENRELSSNFVLCKSREVENMRKESEMLEVC